MSYAWADSDLADLREHGGVCSASGDAGGARARHLGLALVKGEWRAGGGAGVAGARQRHPPRRHRAVAPRIHVAVRGEHHGVALGCRHRDQLLALPQE